MQRPEVADLRTSVVCEHIRNLGIQPARGGARGAREARQKVPVTGRSSLVTHDVFDR